MNVFIYISVVMADSVVYVMEFVFPLKPPTVDFMVADSMFDLRW